MKKWNTPEISALNISETAKNTTCGITGGTCISGANANAWGQCKKCPVYQNQSGTNVGTGSSGNDETELIS